MDEEGSDAVCAAVAWDTLLRLNHAKREGIFHP